MDNGADGARPAKKARIDGPENDAKSLSNSKQPSKWRKQKIDYKRQQRRAELDHPQPESAQHRQDRELFGIDEDFEEEAGLKPLQDAERQQLRKLHVPKMWSQPSVISTGDKGIFVTCDKGREKKCLSDLADLVEEYLEKRELIPPELVDPSALLHDRLDRQAKRSATVHVDNESSPEEDEEVDIESSINAELSGIKGTHKVPSSHAAMDAPVNVRAFQLITLDVPCVSFLRFVPDGLVFEKVDVVDLVHSLCADAANNPGRMRSRYIKRLSPVVWLGKVLSGGLEKACEEVLPVHFRIEIDEEKAEPEIGSKEKDETATTGVKFAIRPTIRNNDKVSRGDVIKKIAEVVQRLGKNKHKVDLTNYDKGVLLDVYRGWIGMGVVDNTTTSTDKEGGKESKVGYSLGYEALKRFNLAEIYADGIKHGEKKSE